MPVLERRMTRVIALLAGVGLAVMCARICVIVPAGTFAYARADSWCVRGYWWFWPSAWMMFGLSGLVVLYDRRSLWTALGNVAAVLGISLASRALFLLPVAWLLSSEGVLVPTAGSEVGGMRPSVCLVSALPDISGGLIAAALLAGVLSVLAFMGAVRMLLRGRALVPLTIAISVHTVVQQCAASVRAAQFVLPLSLMTFVVLAPGLDWVLRRELAGRSHAECTDE